MKPWMRAAVGAMASAAMMTMMVAAESPLTNIEEVENYAPVGGVTVTQIVAEVDGAPQRLTTVTADADDFAFAIGGTQSGKFLVNDMTPVGDYEDTAVVAAVNGDHYSFQTGVPLGMSISDGEILASSVEPYDADEYYFHVMGITADGDVLVGENPTLYMQFTVNGETIAFDRINRTREQWEGAQMLLFTPAYGDSTGTDVMGTEIVVEVADDTLRAGSEMTGTVIDINKDGDSPLKDGTVVISAHILRYQEIKDIAVGDEVAINVTFEDTLWNEAVFAIGGNSTIVEDGTSLHYDYELSTFKDPQPRTAIGVKENGDLVMATADGRSDEAGGMTANDMADYMAYELGCEYAILLDGGGSTAMAVADEDGALQTVNVPSEERPVGNGVMLVQTGEGGVPMMAYLLPSLAAVIAAFAALGVVLFKGRGKNDRENTAAAEDGAAGDAEK